MSDTARAGPLRGLRVGFSGAIPPPEEREALHCNAPDLLFTVRRLAERVLADGATLTYGAHPTFTPIIEDVATALFGLEHPDRVHMHVAPCFFSDPDSPISWDNYVERHRSYCEIGPAGRPDQGRQEALDILRDNLIADAEVLVCIGGRSHMANPNIRPGVDQEVELAIQADRPVYLIGWAGGRTRHVYAHWRDRDPQVLWRNGLTPDQNDLLGFGDPDRPYSISESVSLVLKGLHTLVAARGGV